VSAVVIHDQMHLQLCRNRRFTSDLPRGGGARHLSPSALPSCEMPTSSGARFPTRATTVSSSRASCFSAPRFEASSAPLLAFQYCFRLFERGFRSESDRGRASAETPGTLHT